jgi:hypothetical protein
MWTQLTRLMLGAMVLAAPASAGTSHDVSWGKAGVPLSEYVRDARECAETSRYVTVYIKPATLARLDALSSARLLDTIIQYGGSDIASDIVNAITKLRSADDIARRTNTFGAGYVSAVSFDVKDQLQAVLDHCLAERGYTRLLLTKAQAGTLRHLKRHSAERIRYLHAIDSDAAIIARQRL